ncbi:MAG: NAD-dependent succinate-semialdehyde dehydrogenase [Thermoanaerobaculia bacterium]|nr:NAD-dependent succinate-semialdehyde dehydrogenase [Thermoanaerobaculia bacterium]
MSFTSINPATEEEIRSFDEMSDDDLEAAVSAADDAFREWRLTSFSERSGKMSKAADLLDERRDELARLMTLEMGKPIGQARSEVEKCAWVCRHYAENAERFLADKEVDAGGKKSVVSYQPLGAVLAIMPWNFPLWQVFRFVAPGLMAGNVGLLKHASNVPECALAIAEVLHDAGFPKGVFQTLLIGSKRVAPLLEDKRIRAATLTGSEPAGRDVAKRAGAELKKVVLELGGSDPFVVMPSADLDKAASTAVKARTINNGQSCIAAKRFILHEEIADAFSEKFVEGIANLKVGDPLEDSTDIGPLATRGIRDELAEQVEKTVSDGARILTGGEVPNRKGWFYQPTVIDRIPEGSPADCDELFGPVAAVFRVNSLDEAVEKANDTPFGLGASAWTSDPDEQQRFTRDIEAGLVFINAMVASNPHLPFGGVKNSGYGRELGEHGIHEFVNIKAVWID